MDVGGEFRDGVQTRFRALILGKVGDERSDMTLTRRFGNLEELWRLLLLHEVKDGNVVVGGCGCVVGMRRVG